MVSVQTAHTLLAASGAAALLLLLAAFALHRHLGRVDARLRAVEPAAAAQRAAQTWLDGLDRLAASLTPRAYRAAVHARLERAGLSARVSVARFLAICGLGSLALWGFGLLLSTTLTMVLLLPIEALACVVVGGIVVDRKAARRRHAVQRSLPATLDLLVLAMEAGLSFDAALREVVAEWPSASSREFERVLALTQLGLGRREALQEVADALALDSFRRLASRLGTAERLGSSMVLVMRAEADEARRERRAIATKRMAQAPTKILLPTAFLILPVTMIVVLGPAVPELIRIAGGS